MMCYKTAFRSILVVLLQVFFSLPAQAMEEAWNSGWALHLDNDLLAEQDRDYTGGIALTLSGRRAQEYMVSLEGVRNWLDGILGVDRLYANHSHFQLHSLQYGVMLFTPGDITNPEPIFDDRPYGSVFYLSNTELTVAADADRAWLSTLTFGFLGLDAVEYIQEVIHALTDSDVANGWDNQVSSGGEPTLMLTWSSQDNHLDPGDAINRHELKTAYETNVGFSTDVNVSLSWRWGRINTPWYSFNPQHSQYIQLGTPLVAGKQKAGKGELYLWAGSSIKYRFYSSLMQGQFRDSVVTLSSDEVENLIAQVWLGATWEFLDNVRGSFYYRASSKEFKGPNAHYPVWAGLIINRAF